jgi:TonB-linked SusC/RagA family outer membrane protein
LSKFNLTKTFKCMKNRIQFHEIGLKIMRITLTQFLLAALFFGGSYANTHAQHFLKNTLTFPKETVTLKEFFLHIEKIADVRFLYSSSLVNTKAIIRQSGTPKTMSAALEEALKPLNLDYKVQGKQIILVRKGQGMINDRSISGTVVDEDNQALAGVTVEVKGSTKGVFTDAEGKFSMEVPDNAVLVFRFVGYKAEEVRVGTRTVLNIKLSPEISLLSELVVTGYTQQQKKDIIGAVSVVKASELNTTPSANLVTQLQGRASGVTVSSTGDPGTSASIRIRGFSSYGNNNPLYVIDGVPTTDGSRINPQDIESIQVLKDASSASIYGARAGNGVIIITTKQGKPQKTQVTYDSYVGAQALPFNKTPDLLNTAQLVDYLNITTPSTHIDPVFGQHGSYRIPEYYVVSNNFRGGVDANDPRADPSLYTISDYANAYQIFKTSPGTDWFKAMSQTGLIQSHQLNASGGTEASTYSMGLNYFNQEGTFKHTGFERYTARLNSSFKATKFLTIGENMQLSYSNRKGDNVVIGETSAWANAYRSTPFTPVYDINGGYGGSLIGGISGVGYNPVGTLERRKDWSNVNLRAFGNVYADVTLAPKLVFRSSIGIDVYHTDIRRVYLKEYERAEARKVTQLEEASGAYQSWTWSNTLNYQFKLNQDHDFKLLAGTEAIKNRGKSINTSKNNYDSEDPDFISLNTGLPTSLGDITALNNTLYTNSLFSYFGRVDYTFKDKYLLNATFRRDGSSLFGPDVRYANFPALGIGWRISDEAFLKDQTWISDLKIRAGWGQIGSISNVPAFNQYSTFRSSANTDFYNVGGASSGTTQGYGWASQGNTNTKWETTETVNVGIDGSLFQGAWNFSVDVYEKNTRDLLVPSLRNALEPIVGKPLINLGTMRNRGIDLQIGNQGKITNDLKYDVSLSFTHYKNKLTKLNNENTAQFVTAGRLANVLITTQGLPISSFYGYQIEGFYNNEAEVAAGPSINGSPATVGTWKYRDLDGDGNITTADRMVLGSPHPDFQMGLNLGLAYKNWDFNTFLFWSQGNEIFNYTKFFTYMNVLGGGIAVNKMTDAWTPETASSAKTPRIGVGAENGYTSFVTGNPTSFYVEDGSYLRAKNLQIGYTVPYKVIQKLKLSNLRVYVQAQNLFTLTKYSGADPDLGLISGSSTDQTSGSDQHLGVDYSGFPTPRQFLLGLNLSF